MTFSSLEKDLHVAVEPALAGGNLEAVADVGEKGKFEELGRSVARLKDDRMVIASKFNHGVFRIDSSSAILLSFKACDLSCCSSKTPVLATERSTSQVSCLATYSISLSLSDQCDDSKESRFGIIHTLLVPLGHYSSSIHH